MSSTVSCWARHVVQCIFFNKARISHSLVFHWNDASLLIPDFDFYLYLHQPRMPSLSNVKILLEGIQNKKRKFFFFFSWASLEFVERKPYKQVIKIRQSHYRDWNIHWNVQEYRQEHNSAEKFSWRMKERRIL